MSEIDWANTPLEEFSLQVEYDERGLTTGHTYYPHDNGVAQDFLGWLAYKLQDIYEQMLLDEDVEGVRRYEEKGEVAVIRDGRRGYECLDSLTLADLPAVLDTFVVLERELKEHNRKEAERKAKERKNRERVRAKERRKLKKLGEW